MHVQMTDVIRNGLPLCCPCSMAFDEQPLFPELQPAALDIAAIADSAWSIMDALETGTDHMAAALHTIDNHFEFDLPGLEGELLDTAQSSVV